MKLVSTSTPRTPSRRCPSSCTSSNASDWSASALTMKRGPRASSASVAPVFDYQGQCVGAISLTGLKVDVPDGDVGRLGNLVRGTADRLTTVLRGGRLA